MSHLFSENKAILLSVQRREKLLMMSMTTMMYLKFGDTHIFCKYLMKPLLTSDILKAKSKINFEARH